MDVVAAWHWPPLWTLKDVATWPGEQGGWLPLGMQGLNFPFRRTELFTPWWGVKHQHGCPDRQSSAGAALSSCHCWKQEVRQGICRGALTWATWKRDLGHLVPHSCSPGTMDPGLLTGTLPLVPAPSSCGNSFAVLWSHAHRKGKTSVKSSRSREK